MIRWNGFTRPEIEELCGEPVSFEHTQFYRTFHRYPRSAHFERYSALLDAMPSDRLNQAHAHHRHDRALPVLRRGDRPLHPATSHRLPLLAGPAQAHPARTSGTLRAGDLCGTCRSTVSTSR